MLSDQRHRLLLSSLETLFARKQEMRQTRRNFIYHLLVTSQTYENCLQKSYQSVNQLMDSIATLNLTCDKCYQIGTYVKTMCSLCQSFRKQLSNNILSLKKIQEDDKAEYKVQNKYQEFMKNEKQFYKIQIDYNRAYSQYDVKSRKLNLKVNYLNKSSNNPIEFYDGKSTQEDLNNLQAAYINSRSLQQSLQTQFQVMLQKDRYLSELMKELQERFIELYRKNMIQLLDASKIIVNCNNEDNIIEPDRSESYDDVGEKQMEKYREIYSGDKRHRIKGQNKEISQFTQNFDDFFSPDSSRNPIIENQYDLLEDRCTTIKDKILRNMNSVSAQRKLLIEQLSKQKDIQIEMQKDVQRCKKITLFKNCENQMNNHKRMFKRCFGQAFFKIQELTLAAINYKNQSLAKFAIIIEENKDRLQRLISDQQLAMTNYQKSVQKLLDQHRQYKKAINVSPVGASHNYEAYKANSIETFNNFKKKFNEINSERRHRDMEFNQIMKSLIMHLKNIRISAQHKIVTQEAQRYALLMDIKPEKEVINLMKQNEIFDILFKEGFFLQHNGNFVSLIGKETYEGLKILLERKNQIYLTNKIKKKRSNSCFPCTPKTLNNKFNEDSYPCKLLLENSSSIKGVIYLDGKQLLFERDNNLFQNSMLLCIPTTDIRKVQTTMHGQVDPVEFLELETVRGNLRLKSARLDDIKNMLLPFSTISGNHNDSLEGSMNKGSRSSIILKKSRLNSSTSGKQKIISYYETPATTTINIIPDNGPSLLPVTHQNRDLLKSVVELLQTTNYFDNFKVVEIRKAKDEVIRQKYQCAKSYLRYYLRQSRKVEIFGESVVIATFRWKVSFEEYSLLKSYNYRQKIKVILDTQIPQIQYMQKLKSPQIQKYHQKCLHDQIQRMNRIIGKDITNILQKDVELRFTLEPPVDQIEGQIIDQEEEEQDNLFNFQRRESQNLFIGNSSIARQRIKTKNSIQSASQLEAISNQKNTNKQGTRIRDQIKRIMLPVKEAVKKIVKPTP